MASPAGPTENHKEHKRKRYTPSHDSIMRKIDQHTETVRDCAIWNGQTNQCNTPRFGDINIKKYLWSLSNPPLVDYYVILSSCGNRKCVAVDHLALQRKPCDREIDWESVWERLLGNSKKEDDCLMWQKLRQPTGYGKTELQGRTMSAHRVAYMVKLRGQIPEEINGEKAVIRHLCNKRACINPQHLQLGTSVENCADMVNNGTSSRGEANAKAKISESLAREIKLSRFKPGERGYQTGQARASFYKVPLSIVKRIDSGSSWAHLPDRQGNTHLKRREIDNSRQRAWRKRKRDQGISPEDFEKAGEKLYSRVVKTDKNKKGGISGECWEFPGPRYNGYSSFSFQGKKKAGHIWSCEITAKRLRREGEVVRHLCGNKCCVSPTHVRFGTCSENARDTLMHGTRAAKLDPEKVREIRASGLSAKELGKIYGVTACTISCVTSGRKWKWVE